MAKDRSHVWDAVMITLLLGSIALVFWYEALDPVTEAGRRALLEWVDLGLVMFFVGEWGWRVRASGKDAGRYAVKNSWELLGMIPLLAPLPAFLRALRLLRVVRILRVFNVVGSALGFWERVAERGRLKKVGLTAGVVTLGGAVLVWALERHVNPQLESLREAVWWSVVTVTTVGYGDITPGTAMGRFVAAVLMILGIGIFGVLAASMASVMFEEEEEGLLAQDLAGQLERLAGLHDAGKLTDDEFAAAKAKLLAG